MKLLKYFLLLLIPLLILSCRTPRERAERLVKRANKIFPIDSLVSEKVTIDTLLTYDTTVVIEKDTLLVSIPVYIPGTKSTIQYNKDVVFENSKVKVSATTGNNGSIDLDILLKEHKIQVKGTIKYQKQFITHRKIITLPPVRRKDFFWWTGVIVIGGVVLTTIILSIRSIKQYLP